MFKNKKGWVSVLACTVVMAVAALAVAIKIDEIKTGETVMQSYEKYILDHKR